MNENQSSELVEMLSLQLTEFEMLTSMFPSSEELQIDDPSCVADIQDYINGDNQKIPSRLDFVVNLKFEDKGKLEVWCSLPHDYPQSEPEVYVRSQELNRAQQHFWNDKLMNFIAEDLPHKELCIVSILQWLQEKSDEIFQESWKTIPHEQTEESVEQTDKFVRLWIYSHHIYNKFKRRSILDLAHHLKLTGFCLPGKPGVICVEGFSTNCDSFWDRIKHMNWKKIILKKREVCDEESTKDKNFFPDFQEISFTPRHGGGREYHMDMGEFLRYLNDHNCSYVFKDYFGVDGKIMSLS